MHQDISLNEALLLSLDEKHRLLELWNQAYRTGEAMASDRDYDALLESLPTEDPLRQQIGFEIGDQRKTALPIAMYSMDKVKSIDELHKWMESKSIDADEDIIVTPKYDGLSFLVQPSTGKAYTRGNGTIGQRSDEHFKKLSESKNFCIPDSLGERHLIGEVIMSRAVFLAKYAEKYRNPRNLVAGLFNQKQPDAMLTDVDFIAYGIGEELESKSTALQMIEQYNIVKLPHLKMPLQELDDLKLLELFECWNQAYEIDGLIVEIDNRERRLSLGREKNANPAYSRAWKGFSAQTAETTIVGITFQVSKDGRLAAVAQVKPVSLDGVTVSNVTLYNASMMVEKGWGLGAKVKIIRSGMVIPKIIETLSAIEPNLPTTCPSCHTAVVWNDNRVHLVCSNQSHCRSILTQAMVSFFKVMEIEEVGEKLVEQLYDAGYTTIAAIMKLTPNDFNALDRFAERKANLIYDSIHNKCKDVPLERVQHASGCFVGLGTKKLALVSHFRDKAHQPTLEELLQIDGYSEISARAYLDGIDDFWNFLDALPISIAPQQKLDLSNAPMKDMRLCFTGFRDKGLETLVESCGGKIVSGINAKTTHLVAKDIEGHSSKLKKARELGLVVWTQADLIADMKAKQIKF